MDHSRASSALSSASMAWSATSSISQRSSGVSQFGSGSEFGGTRSLENSEASNLSDDILDMLGSEDNVAARHRDILALQNSLSNTKSACHDVATNLVHLSSELSQAIADSAQEVDTALGEHLHGLSDYASVAEAAVRVAEDQSSNYSVVKRKLVELQAMATQIAELRQVAEGLEGELVALRRVGKDDEEDTS